MRTNILAKEGYGSFEVGTAIPMGNDNIGNTVSRGPAVTYDEGNGAGPDTIVMTGPLGEVYTKALSVHFAKTPLENVLAEETQAMDAAYQTAAISDNVELGLKEIADAVQLKTSNDEILGNVSATVFAVDQTMMNRPEVIDAVEKLRDKANEQGIDYVMAVCVDPLRNISPVYLDSNSTYYGIHDHTVNAENAGKIFTRATECYCASQGMNVVFGMEGLAIWLTDKYKGKANYAQEGFTGFLAGFFASGFVGLPGLSTAVGAGVKAMLESKKREIEKVAGEIQKLKLQGAKAALDQGRISEGRYKTETKMEVPDIVKGAIMGTIPFVASIYNGVNASKLQDASEDLNKKIRKLEELMRAHGIDGKKKSKDDGDHEYR